MPKFYILSEWGIHYIIYLLPMLCIFHIAQGTSQPPPLEKFIGPPWDRNHWESVSVRGGALLPPLKNLCPPLAKPRGGHWPPPPLG